MRGNLSIQRNLEEDKGRLKEKFGLLSFFMQSVYNNPF